MIRSMTGYGRGEALAETPAGTWRIQVELLSVNRRQLDVATNLPGILADLEADVRRLVAEKVSRGRVQVRTQIQVEGGGGSRIQFEPAVAKQMVESLRQFCRDQGLADDLAASDLIRAPGVFTSGEVSVPAESMKDSLLGAVATALSGLGTMQEAEGAHLRADLEQRLELLDSFVVEVATASPVVVDNYRRHLHQRLVDAGLSIDLGDERLLRELGLFAEKCDISEEITRLASHLAQFRLYLAGVEPAGRPLDFLCQELQREVNTIGSKGNDAGIAHLVVSAKTEVEKIREQVQNLQ